MASQSFLILKSPTLSIPPFGRPTLISFSPIRPQSFAFSSVSLAGPIMAQSGDDGTLQPVEAEVLDPSDLTQDAEFYKIETFMSANKLAYVPKPFWALGFVSIVVTPCDARSEDQSSRIHFSEKRFYADKKDMLKLDMVIAKDKVREVMEVIEVMKENIFAVMPVAHMNASIFVSSNDLIREPRSVVPVSSHEKSNYKVDLLLRASALEVVLTAMSKMKIISSITYSADSCYCFNCREDPLGKMERESGFVKIELVTYNSGFLTIDTILKENAHLLASSVVTPTSSPAALMDEKSNYKVDLVVRASALLVIYRGLLKIGMITSAIYGVDSLACPSGREDPLDALESNGGFYKLEAVIHNTVMAVHKELNGYADRLAFLAVTPLSSPMGAN